MRGGSGRRACLAKPTFAGETGGEFVEVIVEVLVTDSSLMNSEHPSLEQRDRSVDSGQEVFPILEAISH